MNPLGEILYRHARSPQASVTLPRLRIHWSDTTTPSHTSSYQAVLGVLAEGRKQVLVGQEAFFYDPLTYLVASVNLPVTSHVMQVPYLAMSLDLDLKALADLVVELPAQAATTHLAYGVARLDGSLLEAVLRYVRLLDQPEHAPLLAPLLEREILYWLLVGPRGPMLRQLARPSSQLSHLNRAIAFIRARFAQPLRITGLAKIAGMSEATFHRHFRAATGMSPLQFQKLLRLQEARRMLLSAALDAASVGYQVGYESPSQFSREYRRLFGEPPGRDSQRVLARSA